MNWEQSAKLMTIEPIRQRITEVKSIFGRYGKIYLNKEEMAILISSIKTCLGSSSISDENKHYNNYIAEAMGNFVGETFDDLIVWLDNINQEAKKSREEYLKMFGGNVSTNEDSSFNPPPPPPPSLPSLPPSLPPPTTTTTSSSSSPHHPHPSHHDTIPSKEESRDYFNSFDPFNPRRDAIMSASKHEEGKKRKTENHKNHKNQHQKHLLNEQMNCQTCGRVEHKTNSCDMTNHPDANKSLKFWKNCKNGQAYKRLGWNFLSKDLKLSPDNEKLIEFKY